MAFRPDLSAGFTSTAPAAGVRPRAISQKRPLRMISLEAADVPSLSEAVNHATVILAAAADASRGGAVVEQIPYVPGEVVDFDKIVLGSAACLAAYAWAAYEFGKVRYTCASSRDWSVGLTKEP